MAEAAKRPAQPAEVPKAPVLGKASGSGDPAVQYLLAERETHRANGEYGRAAEVTAQIAALGFE